jgi:hypothetical protein
MAPSFNNKDLVVGMKHPETKTDYKDAERIAKGWSMIQGNGPAFIYLAKSADDPNAVFLCEFFKGKLEYDQLEKYHGIVKNHLKGAKLMKKGGSTQAEPVEEPASEVATESVNTLTAAINGMEDLKEDVLENLIANSLIEAYGNVAGFKLAECEYLNEKLNIDGTIYFTSGNTRKTTYVFTEAFTSEDGKVNLVGLNEKLGADKQFVMTGSTDSNKVFITESFKRSK